MTNNQVTNSSSLSFFDTCNLLFVSNKFSSLRTPNKHRILGLNQTTGEINERANYLFEDDYFSLPNEKEIVEYNKKLEKVFSCLDLDKDNKTNSETIHLDIPYAEFQELDFSFQSKIIRLSQEIEEISKIYLEEIKNFITISFVLDVVSYNQNLMKKIFKEVELPIRKKNKENKLIEFKYYFSNQEIKDIGNLVFIKPCHLNWFI